MEPTANTAMDMATVTAMERAATENTAGAVTKANHEHLSAGLLSKRAENINRRSAL